MIFSKWLQKKIGKGHRRENIPNESNTNTKRETIATPSPLLPKPLKGKHNIRVFISSTFQDMQEEREFLVKHIFPKLRKLCLERGVGLTEVDLRWGVTEEQAQKGNVLSICLHEIENCRPYFIGILGDRYGWVPESIPEDLINEQPWLKDYREKSITELEIAHGVIDKPQMAGRAFFYFRDPASSTSDKQGEPRDHDEKQRKLKNLIRQSGFPVTENYRDSKELGEKVFFDLKNTIDQEFPEIELNSLDLENLSHETFLESRIRVYVGRQEYLKQIDHYIKTEKNPFIVVGDSGSGKSALLANWIHAYRGKNPETFILFHFIGSSSESTSHYSLMLRIMGEIKKRYDLSDDIPSEKDAIKGLFPKWLSTVSAREKFILVLDGLNQLEDVDNALELGWLPETLPANVKLILSSVQDTILEALQNRPYKKILIGILNFEEREKFIIDYLKILYSKELSEELVRFIAGKEQTGNPLFLQALLEELRQFGAHETLQDCIENYLQADSPKELYDLILNRLEHDYETERPGAVCDVLSLIWAARRGLSEPEILSIANIPPLIWAPILLSLQDSLISRTGLINFSHSYLRQAVYNRYIRTETGRQLVRSKLIDYFKTADLDLRKIEELPWHLSKIRDWNGLGGILSDFDFFQTCWRINPYDVRRYWNLIEQESDLRVLNSFKPILCNPHKFAKYLYCSGELLFKLGYLKETRQVWQTIIRIGDGDVQLLKSFGYLGKLFEIDGSLHYALSLYEQKEKKAIELNSRKELVSALNNQAMIWIAFGKLDRALKILDRQERWAKSINDDFGLQLCLGNKATVFRDKGNTKKARELLIEKCNISKKNGFIDSYCSALNNIALLEKDLGNFEHALDTLKQVEAVYREIGSKTGLEMCLGNMANIYSAKGYYAEAMILHEEEEKLCREAGNKNGLQMCLGNKALIYVKHGNYPSALSLLNEQEQICQEIKSDSILWCRDLKARILSLY